MSRAGDADQYSARLLPAEPEPRVERDPLGPSVTPEPKISLTVVVNVLMLWKTVIIGIVGAFMAAGLIYLEFTTPSYEASTSIMLRPNQISILDDTEAVDPVINTDTPTIQGEIEVLKSRDLAERVVADFNLDDDPEFSPNARLLEEGNDEELLFEGENHSIVVRSAGGRLEARQIGLTSVIELTYRSESAVKAADLANAFAATYISRQLEAKNASMDTIAAQLRERLDLMRDRVRGAEAAVTDAQASEALIDGQSLATVEGQITEMTQRLIQARVDRIDAENTLDNIERAADLGRSLEVLLELRESPIVISLATQREDLKREIAGLQPRLLDRHPDMVALRDQLASVQARIDVELQAQADRLRIQYEGAISEEEKLAENIRMLEAQKTDVDRALQRVRELERTATVEQELYESSLSRLREIDELRSYLTADASVIEFAAIPPWPSSPNKKLIVAFATAMGMMVALSIILVVETTRDTFTNPAALYIHSGVPVLGVFPKLRRLRIDQKMPGRLAGTVSGRETLEAARRVYLTMTPRQTGTARVIGVTSALPGDGKTFVSMLLGQVAAGMQHKTLLIDADLRKPGLYPALNIKEFDGRGLTSLVPGSNSLQAHTWRHPDLPLFVLPADAGGKRIAFDEYSQIRKLAEIIEDAKLDFDLILIRMPPVVPSSDSLSIAPLLDDILFTVAWNKTKRGSVWKGLTDLASIDIAPSGMILNAADLKRSNQRDFYGQNFDYSAVRKYFAS